jgi:hypothetical protein
MRNTTTKAGSKHPGSAAGVLLLLAVLASLVGCQGVSAGHTEQQQVGSLSLPASNLSFGSVAAGSTKTMTVNAMNTGAASVTVNSAVISTNDFSLTAPSLPVTIAAGQSVPMNVMFKPNAAGNFSATVTITSDASDTVVNLALTGTGTDSSGNEGELTPDPTSEAFPSVTVGSHKAETVTLTNTGGASLTISQASISGTGFQLSGIATPLTLNTAQSTTFTVTFAPQSAGSANGTVTMASNASNPTLNISLSGTGTTAVGQLGASPATLAVGNVVVGTSGTASGSLTASGANVTVTAAGTNNAAFTLTGLSLPLTIAAGTSVPFTVTFDPEATGAASATLTFTTDAQTSTTTASATGTGTAAPTHTVSLSWTASTSSNVSGYNIYRAAYSGSCGSFAKLNSLLNTSTLYSDTLVQDGSSYCYATTAVNSSNEESGYSNIVSNVQIPAP